MRFWKDNLNVLALLKTETDVTKWVSPIKLSYREVCSKFGIDIDGDRRSAFFWNVAMDKKLIVTDDLLAWCGYSGEYRNMKTNFLSLVKKNPQITYYEIPDQNYKNKRYIVLDPLDFESLLIEMRSQKAKEIRELYSVLKHIATQYTKYETFFEEARKELVMCQNHQLTKSVHELLQEKKNADTDTERAEQERARAEKRQLEISSELGTIKKRIRIEVVEKLRTEIAPLVSPSPINSKKERRLALICLQPASEWYLVRRQRESFNKAVKSVLQRSDGAYLIKEWHGIAHAVDLGNALKLRLRNLKWVARGNILRPSSEAMVESGVEEAFSDEELVTAIDELLNTNAATELSKDVESIVE